MGAKSISPSKLINYQFISTIANKRGEILRMKKLYSVFSQAHLRAIQENGSPDNWDLIGYDSPIGSVNLLNKWSPYLKLTKSCGNETG